MKLYTAGTNVILGIEYTIKDNSGIFPIGKLLEDYKSDYYGGRVTEYSFAKSNLNYILLIERKSEGMKVIDIAVTDLKHFPNQTIKSMAARKKIKTATVSISDIIEKLK